MYPHWQIYSTSSSILFILIINQNMDLDKQGETPYSFWSTYYIYKVELHICDNHNKRKTIQCIELRKPSVSLSYSCSFSLFSKIPLLVGTNWISLINVCIQNIFAIIYRKLLKKHIKKNVFKVRLCYLNKIMNVKLFFAKHLWLVKGRTNFFPSELL